MTKRRKVRLGDIIEVPTSKGHAYAQYINDHPMWGQLICVFDAVFYARPASFDAISAGPTRFKVFFPLAAAVQAGIFEVICNQPIAGDNQPFPVFRDGNADSNGRVTVWYLWDGVREWKIGALTPEQRKLPLRSIWNDTMLIHKIENGWTPETDLWH